MRAAPLLFVSLLAAMPVAAQRHSTALSEAEEEQIRDAAAEPAQRILVFQTIIETRVKRIQAILANVRAQGRRDDIRENMDQIAGLTDELQSNLEEYDRAHRDLRKPLPKLKDAILRWESVLKQPPEDDTYSLTRKLALETVSDVKAEVEEMIPAEQTYFKTRPPDKSANPGGVGAIEHR